MRAVEVLLKNEAPRKKLREMGIGDTFLKIVSPQLHHSGVAEAWI